MRSRRELRGGRVCAREVTRGITFRWAIEVECGDETKKSTHGYVQLQRVHTDMGLQIYTYARKG